MMTTVTLEMPDEVYAATRSDPDGLKRELRLAAAVTWYRESRISQEVAARIAGLDRTDFLLAKQNGTIPAARPVIEDLLKAGLYLSRGVLDSALARVHE